VRRLGEVLLARGAVTKDQLQGALGACRRQGGRLGTWLVRLGYIGEGALLGALSEQTGCPTATAVELTSGPPDVRSLIPAAFARKQLVVAFGRDGRTLDVAMGNPNDLVLVDELTSLTGLVIHPHVATEAALSAALAIPMAHTDQSTNPPPGPPRASMREWRQFWRLESSPQELVRALEPPPLPRPAVTNAAFPSLGVLQIAEERPTGGSLEELSEVLRVVQLRDDVAERILDFLEPMAVRVALFSFHQGRVMAWAARGEPIVAEDFQTLMLPIDRPSVFLNLTQGADLHVGPVGAMEGNTILADALGLPAPEEAVVAPIRLRGKVVAFLWLDNGDQAVSDLSVPVVREVARLAGLALEVIVLRQKIKVGGRLTDATEPN
jgi:MshEN domain